MPTGQHNPKARTRPLDMSYMRRQELISSLARSRAVRRIAAGAFALAVGAGVSIGTVGAAKASSGGSTLFITSAVEHPDRTVTFPLHQGISGGKPVYYVITEASDGSVAQALGVNTSQKLANAANTAAVEKVSVEPDGTVVFPA